MSFILLVSAHYCATAVMAAGTKKETSQLSSVEELTLQELHRLQQKRAAHWDQNKICDSIQSYIAENRETLDKTKMAKFQVAGADLGFCMGESVYDFLRRQVEKDQLMRMDSATDVDEPIGYETKKRRWKQSIVQRGLQDRNALDDPLKSPHDGFANGCAAMRAVAPPAAFSWPPPHTVTEVDKIAESARAEVEAKGVVLLRGVGAGGVGKQAIRHLLQMAVSSNKTEYVHKAKHRHHLRLHPDDHPTISTVFKTLVQTAGPVLLPLVSSKGTLVEFAAFLTNPGAEDQELHQDGPAPNEFAAALDGEIASLYSVFLFLTDVDDLTNGPLLAVPETHLAAERRNATRRSVQHLIQSQGQGAGRQCQELVGCKNWALCPVRRGDVVVYDSSIWHRASRNPSRRTRIVVYMTFKGLGKWSDGPTYAIDNSLLQPPRRLGELLATWRDADEPYGTGRTTRGKAVGGRKDNVEL